MDMGSSSFIAQIGIVVIVWGALYRYRKTTSRWVFVAAIVSTCFAALLALSTPLGLAGGLIDILSLANVFLNMFILLAVGQSRVRREDELRVGER